MTDSEIEFRIGSDTKKAFHELCQSYNADMSPVLRTKVRNAIKEGGDAIPEWIRVSGASKDIKEKKRIYQQIGHLPNNFHQELMKEIDKPYPKEPGEMKDLYHDPYKEQVELAFGDERQERKVAQLAHAMDLYSFLHPRGKQDEDRAVDAITHFAIRKVEEEDMETARAWVKSCINDGLVPESFRDEIFDRIRETRKAEWQTAFRPYLETEEA